MTLRGFTASEIVRDTSDGARQRSALVTNDRDLPSVPGLAILELRSFL